MNNIKIVKIVSGALLLVALLSLPYSYYQFLRWAVMIASIYLAYTSFTSNDKKLGWIFVVVALIFNPIKPFFFDKSTWQILDLITSGVFFISLKKR